MFLFWCTTDDGDEDWFIVASSDKVAAEAHEAEEGYDPGDASADYVCRGPCARLGRLRGAQA